MEDELLIELSFTSTEFAAGYDEPDRFVYTYSGDIFNTDDNDARIKIGKFTAHYVDVVEAINEGESIFDVLDCHSSSTSEYLEPIFGNNLPEFSDDVEEINDGYADGLNLLILDRIEIIPEFRGRSIGLKVLRHLMVRFSKGAGIIALKAFPLQYENEKINQDDRDWQKLMSFDRFLNDECASKEKLKDYYGALGFISLPDSDFMVFPTGLDIPILT
jgi:hypothetical protein